MFNRSDNARLEYVLSLIDDIETIIERHGDVYKALDDREGFHALMMCCMQIGEAMGKLENEKLQESLPVRLSYALRNVIAHDYLGVSTDRIADTIKNSIPELKNLISKLI